MYFVYILKCSDNTYYTGMTTDINRRLNEHNSAHYPNSYTSKRRPVELLFYTEFSDKYGASSAEKRIKKWSQQKKEALIQGRY